MFNFEKSFTDENKTYIANIILISFLPLILVTRSAMINIFTVLIPALFLITIIAEKKINFLHDKIFYLLCFFWFSLILNLLFSTNFSESFWRAIGFGKFILLVFSIKYYFIYKNYKFEKLIYKIWLIIFFIISFDLIFEFILGFNLLGYKSPMAGRLSGFLNNELKIGHYYSAFLLISLSYIYYNHKNYYYFYLLSFLFIFISFIIGERSNFLKTLIIFFTFHIIFIEKLSFKKILFFLFFFILLFFFTTKNEAVKIRFWDQFLKPIVTDSKIYTYVKESHYGAHYDTAIKIFYSYPIFGVGLKNYRNESLEDKYKSGNKNYDSMRWATHPHQVHFEFLAETGIFGYFFFIMTFVYSLIYSIKSYQINKNKYQLSSILFIIVSILPILPSGSFFTTYGATIFWINYAIMITYNK